MLDRLVRAEMLAAYAPDLYRHIEVHLARLAEQAHLAAVAPVAGARPDTPDVEWVPATDELAERARFLRGIALLASLDQRGIGALAEAAKEEIWPAASEILREGALAERFYIVRTGDVTVNRFEGDGARHRVARLGPGEWFGESGLLDGAVRAATITAGTARPVQLLSFDANVFATWISPYVTSYRGRELVSRRRSRLEEVPLFRALAPVDLDRLARALREERVEAGSIVFRQGDPADAFYVIVDGAVGVIKDGAPIAKLTSGEFFGETALLFTQARTATVAATQASTFWVLDRGSFTTFVREVLLHRRDMMPTVMGRLGSSEPL
jgi:CRP-like cAMP-binding protein